jgi:hypothetical protein
MAMAKLLLRALRETKCDFEDHCLLMRLRRDMTTVVAERVGFPFLVGTTCHLLQKSVVNSMADPRQIEGSGRNFDGLADHLHSIPMAKSCFAVVVSGHGHAICCQPREKQAASRVDRSIGCQIKKDWV